MWRTGPLPGGLSQGAPCRKERHWCPQRRQEPGRFFSWINKPAAGILTGTLFTDGAAFGVDARMPRAGFSIVSVDETGELLAACFGPLPADVCPGQTIADAEDFALAEMASCAVAPISVHTDRLDTVIKRMKSGVWCMGCGPLGINAHG